MGFLHGFLPQGISRDYIIRPTKVRILTTDELLFPKELRTLIEDELHVKLEVTLTRDWNVLLAKTVATPSEDIIFLPSYWATTLRQQNLLSNMALNKESELQQRVAPDFIDTSVATKKTFDFLPFYWIKTGILSSKHKSFTEFLKDKTESTLFLLADEDLILKHFQIWNEQGLGSLVAQKKILTLQLDQILKTNRKGVMEVPLNEINPDLEISNQLSALIVWGAVIPMNSDKKDLAQEILNVLTTPLLQEKVLVQTPFNSTLTQVSDQALPVQRRASYIRDLQLKDTLLIDKKDVDAKSKLKNEFNLVL
ncbi:hypothetical protein [Bdellovibrio svalbardensis]|uniref:Extracellular solute-binding protein n=1 Tax=Bdellovibrio svalbardensis TaxID=2972972 RepID=A0ABT6DIE1_9BACT|nr:hypothetical protein [Bdellovibrio svalbardensis]MDG0816622.1 hypothetical protein [Bdellovibrio svalbardensis]